MLFCESEGSHAASKFSGALGVEIGAGLWWTKIAGVGKGVRVASTISSSFDSTAASRIARYDQKLQQAAASGRYSKEKLGEFAGRIDMLRDGYLPIRGGKSIWKYRGNNGIDRVFQKAGDPTDLRVLESKFSSGFTAGRNPATVLSKGIKDGNGGYWRQMSPDWIDEVVSRLIQTGDPNKVRAGSLLLEFGYQRYINVANELGQSFFRRL